MPDTGTAVLDRIVDGETAVLLLEEGGETVDQLDVPLERLPSAARVEGTVMRVTIADGELRSVEPDLEETERRQESAQEKFDRLSKRLSDREE